ncbi:PepSY-associated TM helix domain-containing protein [Brytella acorum]|uniref:PepSY-associated TM helix domain-containing protein n=2 Tax=Brytella acorum TaxID=2959299 RepID=A0AA35UH86_9PROT|nr:PepSY-associated TM helix domain-containing protein [Brytella acorum]CAI9121277.1 PepSY-associated TM helix domain-containing protein [Brytella acorum]
MKGTVLRRWVWIHKWTSIISTVFLLILCTTGLPLIFGDEIVGWNENSLTYSDAPGASSFEVTNAIVSSARGRYPGQIVISVFVDDDEPQTVVGMARSWPEYNTNPRSAHFLTYDSGNARLLRDDARPVRSRHPVMAVLQGVHKNLLSGLTGSIVLASVSLCFCLALLSGVIVYAPFMRGRPFGTVRSGRRQAFSWLDFHNFLGMALTVWMAAVGITGFMNALSDPLFMTWQQQDVRKVLNPWQGQTPPPVGALAPIGSVLAAAQAALPGMRIVSAVFPGAGIGSPFHYLVWVKGDKVLTGRLFTAVLVDARSGQVSAVLRMPWYLNFLELSRPLHFGDYGGMPLKVIWASLDLVVIAVLVSGIVLWIGKRKIATGAPLRALGSDINPEHISACLSCSVTEGK